MADARRDPLPPDGRLFWTLFTLVALVWAVAVFAVSMTWRRAEPPVKSSGVGSAAGEGQAATTQNRFKTALLAEGGADRKL